MKTKKVIEITTLKYGQPRPYADSEYLFELEVEEMSEFEVMLYCTKVLRRCSQTNEEWQAGMQDANVYFNGYFTFNKVGENKYRYFVLEPYTD